MHPRAAAPGDRHTARAGVFSLNSADDGFWQARECTQKLRNLTAERSEENRRGKSSHVKSQRATRTKLLLELHVYESLNEMSSQVKSLSSWRARST